MSKYNQKHKSKPKLRKASPETVLIDKLQTLDSLFNHKLISSDAKSDLTLIFKKEYEAKAKLLAPEMTKRDEETN